MATRNDITGDELRSGATTDSYRDGWDRIFGNKPPAAPPPEPPKPDTTEEQPNEAGN